MALPMRRTILLTAVSLALLCVAAFAFDWPSEGGRYRYGFGSYRGGFLLGTEFGAEDGVIRSAADGELVFSAAAPSLPGGFPLAGGSLLALTHASDIMTLYAGMTPDTMSQYLRLVRKGDVLGSGASAREGRGAVYYTYDARARRYINPLILMPTLSDERPPLIRNVSLVHDEGELALDQVKSLRQGSYHLAFEASDQSPAGNPSAPFELRVLIDGFERSRVVYDAAWADTGSSRLFGSSGSPEAGFFGTDGRVRLGPYVVSRGKVVLTIVATDFSGNKREQTYSLSVF